jgi:hypothetical protein
MGEMMFRKSLLANVLERGTQIDHDVERPVNLFPWPEGY